MLKKLAKLLVFCQTGFKKKEKNVLKKSISVFTIATITIHLK